MGPADTGRPPREPEGGPRAGANELGRQAGGLRSWSAGCFAESVKRWKEEMKVNVPPSFVAPKNWVNWKKMEIARTPVGGEGGTA